MQPDPECPRPQNQQRPALGLDPELWADAQALTPLLGDADLGRAVDLLQKVRGLWNLLQVVAADLEAIGLSPSERSRVLASPALAGRIQDARSKAQDRIHGFGSAIGLIP